MSDVNSDDERLPAELKARWVDALRSGKYQQGRGWLRASWDSDGIHRYCCIGVLCDVVDPKGWQENEGGVIRTHTGNNSTIPISVQAKTGLMRDRFGPLYVMNDSGKSFAEIAEYIEANL